MTDDTSDHSTFSPLRRGLLFAAPVACLGVASAVYWGTSERDAPINLGAIGPFRAVYVVPRDDQSRVDATLVYPFGERHNPDAEGLAHYLEHLVWANVRDAGDDGGTHSNALTSPQATGYLLSRSPADLLDVIRRLAASAAPLQATAAYARQERDIVQREFDVRRLDAPLDPVWIEMRRALYGKGPYGRTTLGTKASIDTFTFEVARALHDQTHQLATATLLIRGPVTVRDVEKAIAAQDTWPAPRAPVLSQTLPNWPETKVLDFDRYSVTGLGSPMMIYGTTSLQPPSLRWAETQAAHDLLRDMVFSTQTGGLARPLRYDQFVASTFDFGVWQLGAAGFEMWLTAEPDSGVSLDTLRDAATGALTSLLSDPSPTLFQEMKNRRMGGFSGDLDPMDTNADNLFHTTIQGSPYVTASQLKRATWELTHAEFKDIVGHFLTPRSSATRLLLPASL